MKNITININNEQVTGNWNEKVYSSKEEGCIRIYLDGTAYHISKEKNMHIFEEDQEKTTKKNRKTEIVNVVKAFKKSSQYQVDDNKVKLVFRNQEDADVYEKAFDSIGLEKDKSKNTISYTITFEQYNAACAFFTTIIIAELPYGIYKKADGKKVGDYNAATKTIEAEYFITELIYNFDEYDELDFVEEYIQQFINILTNKDDRTRDEIIIENALRNAKISLESRKETDKDYETVVASHDEYINCINEILERKMHKGKKVEDFFDACKDIFSFKLTEKTIYFKDPAYYEALIRYLHTGSVE